MYYSLNDMETKIADRFENFTDKLEDDFFKDFIYRDEVITHYTSAEGLLGILQSKAIRFTEYAYLNDDTEGKCVFDLLDERLISSDFDKDFTDCIIEELKKGTPNEIYDVGCERWFVCCFSLNDDSLSMWNYYTKNPSMKGYNLQFNSIQLADGVRRLHLTAPNEIYYETYRVLYSKKEQMDFLNHLLNYVFQIWCRDKNTFIIRILLNYLYSVRFAFKHFAFEAEEEMRIVIKMSERQFQEGLKSKPNNSELIKLKISGDFIVPFLEIPFNPKCIKGIKSSPLIKDQKARDSVQYILNKYGYKGVKVRPSGIPLKH